MNFAKFICILTSAKAVMLVCKVFPQKGLYIGFPFISVMSLRDLVCFKVSGKPADFVSGRKIAKMPPRIGDIARRRNGSGPQIGNKCLANGVKRPKTLDVADPKPMAAFLVFVGKSSDV